MFTSGSPTGGFEEFSKGKRGSRTGSPDAKHSFSFTTDLSTAEDYARGTTKEHAPSILPVYLKIKNPKRQHNLPSVEDIKRAKNSGHDGIIVTFDDGVQEITVFRPEQIKSAIGNRGTFDPKSKKINEATE